jgi:aryl-alcohol dehydrogenase-like predicted oxidoreductase
LQYRTLGRTGLRLSEIGFGAWGIGKGWWGETPDDLSIRTLIRAFESGVRFVDTAYYYGTGHSERLIAKAFDAYGARVPVATKVPLKSPDWPPPPGTPAAAAFPPDWIVEHTEKSLRNLKTDAIDLQQLHIWRDEWLREPGWQEAVARLKAEGKIRFFGISLIDHAPETGLLAVQSGIVDAIQVIYNIFDPSPAPELFPLCEKHNVGVIARVPLDEGSLGGTWTRETRFAPGTFQAHYFRETRLAEACERAERLRPFLGPGVETLPKLALKFCLSHPAVSTVIPGMRTPGHVDQNVAASDGKPLPPSTLEALREHAWPRNFYD